MFDDKHSFGDEYIEETPKGFTFVKDLQLFFEKCDDEKRIKEFIYHNGEVYLSSKTIEYLLDNFPLIFENIKINRKVYDYVSSKSLYNVIGVEEP